MNLFHKFLTQQENPPVGDRYILSMKSLKYAHMPELQHDMLKQQYALPLASENEILIEKTPYYSQKDFEHPERVTARLKGMKA